MYTCESCGKNMYSLTEYVERSGQVYCKQCDPDRASQQIKYRQHEELKLNPNLPYRRSRDRKRGGKDWQGILNNLALTDSRPEEYRPGKLTSPYHSLQTYSDVMAMVVRLSELEGQYYTTINVYPTYIEAILNLPGHHSETFRRVGGSHWQHEVAYEDD